MPSWSWPDMLRKLSIAAAWVWKCCDALVQCVKMHCFEMVQRYYNLQVNFKYEIGSWTSMSQGGYKTVVSPRYVKASSSFVLRVEVRGLTATIYVGASPGFPLSQETSEVLVATAMIS